MRYTKWAKKIVIFFIAGTVFNANAKDINCSLNMDCAFSSIYNDRLHVPVIEKADYKCHVTQKNNISAYDSTSVINTIIGYGVIAGEEIDLGGKYGNEGNLYFPARKIAANEKTLDFIVKEKNLSFWNFTEADITINCTVLQ